MTNTLKFQVEESVWFNHGDEIGNILSISLDPDIAVEETGDYVTVKGSLRLGGEYERLEKTEEQEESLDRSTEQTAFRTVQEVRELQDDVSEFQHHFPVEITIPKKRVTNVDEIRVTVESFDYQIPTQNHLRMSAQLAIEGIQEEQADPIENYNFDERVKNIYVQDKVAFVIDTKSEENISMEVEKDAGELVAEGEDESLRPQFELKSREEIEDRDTNGQLMLDSLRKKSEEIVDDELSMEQSEDRNIHESDVVDEELEQESDDESELKPSVRSENALYLTKMLTRGEEQFSRLRMRIIQPGESLDSIAEAYELQPTQIARLNRLHDEQIEEGQILYIPVQSSEKQ